MLPAGPRPGPARGPAPAAAGPPPPPAPPPTTMRAAVVRRFGPPSAIEVVPDWPRPARRPGELLVRVATASVTPQDCKIRRGEVPRLLTTLPKVLGGDVAGVVVEADPGALFPPGTPVAFLSDGFRWGTPHGSSAEFVAAPEVHVAALPPRLLSWAQAAALPMAALTALQAFEPLQLKKYDRMLIHGGAGGVGSAAIQVAKARGLHVTTTCAAEDIPFVRQELGADVAVDYARERFEDAAWAPYDCILDLVGGDYEQRSLRVLKKWGTYCSVLAAGDVLAAVKGKAFDIGPGPRYNIVITEPSGRRMEEALQLVAEGKLRPVVDRVLPLEQAREAHEAVEGGRTRGRVVLAVADL